MKNLVEKIKESIKMGDSFEIYSSHTNIYLENSNLDDLDVTSSNEDTIIINYKGDSLLKISSELANKLEVNESEEFIFIVDNEDLEIIIHKKEEI